MMELSVNRTYLLIKKQLTENLIRYGLSGVVMCMLISAYIIIRAKNETTTLSEGVIYSVFNIAPLIFGGFFAISLFSAFHNKQKGTWLMLPASALERLLAIFILIIVFFPVVHLLLFAVTIKVMSHLHPLVSFDVFTQNLRENTLGSHIYFYYYVLCQTGVAACAICVRRYSYLVIPIVMTVLFEVSHSGYYAILKAVFNVPAGPTDVHQVDVYDRPEKWEAGSYVKVRFTDVTQEGDGKKTRFKITDKIAGDVRGTMYGFAYIDQASSESAETPVVRYFSGLYTGHPQIAHIRMFSYLFYAGLVLTWIGVWLRIKETQL
ncbi:hypothetical protein [Mucilaginibacter myungsuensis]|uniref:Uncharacterized protein n=1 Tax=Mucilaginibacter myungsuensis TaxID=649104 RepID=A0A929KV43_9SPHI|nr:hypothetical protein [Mucilaginibacter myungsuensis]MBE9660988.1 hypothetical protein [Mucilaginibacter myungsuensis]MDN3601034.1 hypothetical protein [Mucilaginibacter myungsuensis]